jgi:hypothetical protein
MPERVYEFDISEHQQLKKAVLYDPYTDSSITPEQLEKIKADKFANVIFSRQTCVLKDGTLLDLDSKKCYLYIKAEESFLNSAEERLKAEFKSFKRADPDTESKVASKMQEDESKGNYGVGLLFGG